MIPSRSPRKYHQYSSRKFSNNSAQVHVRTHTHTHTERKRTEQERRDGEYGRQRNREEKRGREQRIGWLIGFTEQTCYIVPKEYEMYYVGSGKRHMHNKTLKQ